MQITREHLKFMDECVSVFENEPLRETHINDNETLIGLRYGLDRDCVRIYQLDGEVGFFANIMKKQPRYFSHEREEVRWFAGLMEAQLKANDQKGGWMECSDSFLMRELRKNLLRATNPVIAVKDATRRLVNVANFAMMIADKMRLGR